MTVLTPPLSRQAKWQAAHRAAGLCILCSEPAVKGSSRCATHLIRSRLRERTSSGSQPWRPGGPGHPPLVP